MTTTDSQSRPSEFSANRVLTNRQAWFFGSILAIIVIGAVLNWRVTATALLGLSAVYFVVSTTDRVVLMLRARTGEPDAARDLSQDVFIAVVCALRKGQLREQTRLGEFAHGVVRNVANNYLRARRRQALLDALPDTITAPDVADPVEAFERPRFVSRALASMLRDNS